jgi:hypothetical protein
MSRGPIVGESPGDEGISGAPCVMARGFRNPE